MPLLDPVHCIGRVCLCTNNAQVGTALFLDDAPVAGRYTDFDINLTQLGGGSGGGGGSGWWVGGGGPLGTMTSTSI